MSWGKKNDPDRACAQIARRDFGVIHDNEARAVGITSKQIRYRLSSGMWEVVLPQTYRMPGVPDSWELRAMAACKWAGPGSALSFGACARARGIRGFERADVEISTVGRKRPHDFDFKVHRCDEYLLDHIERVGPLPVTSVPRTVMDLAGRKHFLAERMLDDVLRNGSSSLGAMWEYYEEEWIRGRRGVAILRAWLQERTPGLAPTDEDLAEDILVLIRRNKLAEPMREFPLALFNRNIRFDLAYPDRLLAIEADSYAWHGDREPFDSDRERDADVGLLGWHVLRFSWAQIRFRPDYVVESIRRYLELRPPGYAAEWTRRHAS